MSLASEAFAPLIPLRGAFAVDSIGGSAINTRYRLTQGTLRKYACPITTKFGMATHMEKGRVSIGVSYASSKGRPQKFRDLLHARTQYEKQ